MKCHICGKGWLSEVKDIVMNIGTVSFIVKGQRCDMCKEEIIDEKEGQKMIVEAKKRRVWDGLKLRRKLSKSGRGTILRIPTDIEHDMKLKGDEQILISKVGSRKILIEID